MARPNPIVEFRPGVAPFYVEEGFLTLPGANGDYLSTPDTAVLDIVGDLDVRVEVTLDDWTPATDRPFAAKWNTAASQSSWIFYLRAAGVLAFAWSANGTSAVDDVTSTVAPTVPSSGRLAVRAALDVSAGASNHAVIFYTGPSLDGPWVQLGEPVTGSGTTSIFNSTAVLEIGTHNNGTPTGALDPLAGTVHGAELYAGLTGTDLRAAPDCTGHATGTTSFVDAEGLTWTVNGNAALDDGVVPWVKLTSGGPHGNRVQLADWQWGQERDDDEWPPGDGTLELYNHDRLFDPDNTSGTYTGQLLPGVQFRIRSSSISLDLPGAAGATASTPDHADFAVTDLEVRVHLSMDDWTPGGFGAFLVGQWPNVAGNNGWVLAVRTTGELDLNFTTNGSTTITRTSTVATGFADGSDHWLCVTLDADDGAGNHDVTFYTSEDGVTWSQLGAVVQTAGTVALFNSTAALAVGDILPLAGQVRSVELLGAIDGTAVADPDFTRQTPGATSFTDSTGRLWSVNGTAAIAFGDDVLRDQFYGFVDSGWEQTYAHPEDGYCTVKLTDAFGMLAGFVLPDVFDAAVLDLDASHYYRMDVTAGSEEVGDLAGSVHGSVFGDVEFTDEALLGVPDSAEFNPGDENTDRIDLTRSRIFGDSMHASVAAVFRTTVAAQSTSIHPIFQQATGDNSLTSEPFVLYVNTSGQLQLDYNAGGVGASFVTSAVNDGDAHVGFGQSNVGVAMDFGVAVDTATLSTTAGTGFFQSGNGAAIGGGPNVAGGYDDNFFEGDIAAVAVWDAVLTASARQALLDAVDALDGQRSDQHIRWALNRAGVPDDFLNLDEGRAIMGPALTGGRDALEFCRDVMRTEQGALFVDHADGGRIRLRERYADWLETRATVVQATFSDDPAESFDDVVRAEPADLVVEANGRSTVVNRWTVGWQGGEETAEDEESRRAYGSHGDSIDTQAPSPTLARGIAQFKLAQTKDPKTRLRGLGFTPSAVESAFGVAVSTEIGDRTAYRSQPSATGSVTTKDLQVRGIRHHVEGRHWHVQFSTVTAPDAQVQLFTLGVSVLDGPDILAV